MIIFTALAALVFLGTTNEGQASLLDNWFQSYIEETAVAFRGNSLRSYSATVANQLVTSQFVGTGGDGAIAASPGVSDAPTVHESAVVAISAPQEDYLDHMSGRRSQIIQYTVQDGDLLSFISSDYGISTESLIWANNLSDADSITPGQVLRIPPVSGVIHKVAKGDTASSLAKKYGADEGRIIAYNRLPQDGSLEVGDELVVPDGRLKDVVPSSAVARGTPSVPLLGTASVARLNAAAKQFAHLPDLGKYFRQPTYGFNWGNIHGRNGVDMANACGTPIYAAADGTVTVSDATGYNGGFGKYLKISHPNGTETLYAHASKILVSAGQVVGSGEKIALMGTTGRSTGCHLHFEVHGARNPLAKY